jgi:hypothetical protein
MGLIVTAYKSLIRLILAKKKVVRNTIYWGLKKGRATLLFLEEVIKFGGKFVKL